ncbi:MAG TPA: hypothetical protein VGL53_09540 [Bryobacteraceae bacterium]|jgi:hypothetical protein
MIRERITTKNALLLIALAAPWQVWAQSTGSAYPRMAPINQYMMTPDAEIAMAKSAAPASISHDAEIMVLEKQGYKTAVKGTNGFLCMVMRSWAAGTDAPEFWNPKARSPICFNPPAIESYLPLLIKKTEWVLAGRSQAQMADSIKAAFDKKEFTVPAPSAMGYMMSKEGHLNDSDGHWHPHIMFYVPKIDLSAWGAGRAASPVFGFQEVPTPVTVFAIPVSKWSDGSDASHMK